MKKRKSLWLLFLLLLPLMVYSQTEDTLFIPDLYGTGLYLNAIIAADTAGTGWQGANGITAWQNRTRVYVLQRLTGEYPAEYPVNASLGIGLNRTLKIRAEYGPGRKPLIALYGTTPPGNFVSMTRHGTIVNLSNLVITGYNEEMPGSLANLQGALVTMPSTGNGSIYIDSCILKSTNGNHVRTDGRGRTVRITNSIFADMGSLFNSNYGAGKGIDIRNSGIDTLDMRNNTFINWQDRIIRHYASLKPIENLIFNNNTLINGTSYHSLLGLGWVDSLGTGKFEIKNNLLLDPCVMGNDTDAARQAEFIDSGELDTLNGRSRIVWIVARPNAGVKWDISHNYYAISDAGAAVMGELGAPYISRTQRAEAYLTYNMNKRINELGGDTLKTFIRVPVIRFVNAPPVMSENVLWYRLPRTDPHFGAGKEKRGGGGVGDPNFTRWNVSGVGVFYNPKDYNRRSWRYYTDTLNCNFSASIDLSTAGSDGGIVGSKMWQFVGQLGSPAVPTLASPEDGATGQPIDVVLSWNPSAGAATYHLQVATDDGFASPVFDDATLTAVNKQMSGLLFNTKYYWRVRASNAYGTSSWSVVRSFTTIIAAPAAPTLALPEDGATGQPINVVLSWNPSAGAATYNLQVATDDGFASPVFDDATLTAVNKQMSGLLFNTKYYWRVRASNAGGTGAWSVVRNFTTIIAAPAAPTLALPEDGATGQPINVVLSWNPVAEATTYRLQVATNDGFTPTIFDDATLTEVSKQMSGLELSKLHYWRVSASNAGGTGPWSVVRSFTTGATDVTKFETLPTEFALLQNYPNPFNPSTMIQYDIPHQAQVRLTIYNVLGNEVAVLVNGVKSAGRYTVEWMPTNLSSGIYFYRLQAESFVLTKKLILMK